MRDLIKDSMSDSGLTAREVINRRNSEKRKRDGFIGSIMSGIPYAREVYHAIKMIDNLLTVDR